MHRRPFWSVQNGGETAEGRQIQKQSRGDGMIAPGLHSGTFSSFPSRLVTLRMHLLQGRCGRFVCLSVYLLDRPYRVVGWRATLIFPLRVDLISSTCRSMGLGSGFRLTRCYERKRLTGMRSCMHACIPAGTLQRHGKKHEVFVFRFLTVSRCFMA